MKKSLFLMFVLVTMFSLSSCTETKYVTKKSTLDDMVDSVKTQMASDGYHYTGFSTKMTNELEVIGVSYTIKAGYGTALKNNFVTQDTYTFADSLGNTAAYSIFYSLDKKNNVKNAGLCGCETSNSNDYDKVCGKLSRIDWMPNNDIIEGKDPSVALVIIGTTIMLGVILSRALK